MKIAIVLCCLAVYVAAAATSDCDPDAEGVPNCATYSNGAVFRNNWDPTHYFQCQSGQVVSVPCSIDGSSPGGFDPTLKRCVDWSEWKWAPVC